MAFRKPYDGKRYRVSTHIDNESMTKQSFKQECDINHLLRNYQKTGLIEHVARFNGDYSDLTDVPTYHDAMNKIISADEAFSLLPSEIRNKFKNNPSEFLAFVSDESNRDEMIKLGLIQEPILPSTPVSKPVEDTEPPPPVE